MKTFDGTLSGAEYHMNYLYLLLPVPVLGLMVILMYRRKQHRSYPIFWGFLLFQCPRLISEALFYRFFWEGYFYTYWITSACDAMLSLLLLPIDVPRWRQVSELYRQAGSHLRTLCQVHAPDLQLQLSERFPF